MTERDITTCRHWQWMPGTLTTAGDRVIADYRSRLGAFYDSGGHWPDSSFEPLEEWWKPDLTDPATKGCLLEMVRAAWGDPTASVLCNPYEDEERPWSVFAGEGSPEVAYGPTEEAALAAALWAAP